MSDLVFSNSSFSDAAFDFEEYLYNDKRADDKKVSKDKKLAILKVVVLCLAILLVVEGILYAAVIPCLAPAKIECYGLNNITMAEVTKTISVVDNSTWFKFDTNKAVEALYYVPGIETVSVEKSFPDRVVINIKEREACAKTIVSANGRSMTVQIDKNGVLFTSSAASVVNDSNIPLITGLPVQLQEGTRLPAKYRNLMERIAAINALPQKYFAAISEIQVVPKDFGNYELVLYPVHSRIKVLTDSALSESALEYMIVTLDVVNRIELDVSEIDLRYGSVSYKSR